MSNTDLGDQREKSVSHRSLIRKVILEKILSGAWPTETRVPSEAELVKHFNVSRMTVHHALKSLQAEGYLSRVQGMGTFVARPRSHNTVIRLYNVAEEVRARGSDYRLEVIERGKRFPTAAEASLFRISKQSAIFHLLIRHFENGEPIQLERRLVNIAASPEFIDQDFEQITPFDYLMKQFPYPEGRHVVRAVIADAEEAALLSLDVGAPCLEIERTTWLGDMVINHVVLKYPANRYEITGEITRLEAVAPSNGEA